MKNSFPQSIRVTVSIGFIQAGIAWLLARWLDAMIAQIASPDFTGWITEAIVAGLVFAMCSLRSYDTRVLRYNTIISMTLSLGIFFIPLLIWMPGISARALVLFYALALVIDTGVTNVLPMRIGFIQSMRLTEYFNSMPHAVFLIAGLSVDRISPIRVGA